MQRIVFDTDLGIDDALALLYLLRAPEAKLEAITTVHGNVPVDVATRNVFEVLSVVGVDAAPLIAQGSAMPLAAAGRVNATDVHGDDGLGGWSARGLVPLGELSDQAASKLICEIARKYPRDVTLLLIGPATNAALALREDADGFRLLKDIVMMSGAIFEPGNITAAAEFNMYADPEAAREVIRCGVPVLLVGLDVTRKVSVTRQLLEDQLGGRNDVRAQFLRCVAAQGFSFYKNTSGWEGFHLHDPLAAAVALDRSLVKMQRMNIDVETSGELTRGMTVAERRPWIKGKKDTEVCVSVEEKRFLELFCQRVFST
jgi:purine nucleosidase